MTLDDAPSPTVTSTDADDDDDEDDEEAADMEAFEVSGMLDEQDKVEKIFLHHLLFINFE